MDLIKQQNLKDDVDTFIGELSQTQGWSNTPILSLNKHQWDEKFELNNGNARFFRITELSAEEEAKNPFKAGKELVNFYSIYKTTPTFRQYNCPLLHSFIN